MATTFQGLVLLDPTSGPRVERRSRAPRPGSLHGLRVGYLDNGKRNSDRVLHHLDELLREQFDIAASLHRRKPSSGRAAPPDLVEEMARECDVIIPGVGD